MSDQMMTTGDRIAWVIHGGIIVMTMIALFIVSLPLPRGDVHVRDFYTITNTWALIGMISVMLEVWWIQYLWRHNRDEMWRLLMIVSYNLLFVVASMIGCAIGESTIGPYMSCPGGTHLLVAIMQYVGYHIGGIGFL